MLGETVNLFESDIDDITLDHFKDGKVIAWDIETSGLDWKTEHIATCQLYSPDGYIAMVRIREVLPTRLKKLLEDKDTQKIFHHAMFDLRFMVSKWKASPRYISCTKIAAKLLDKDNLLNHSLVSLLNQYLGVSIDKSEQLSDWFSSELTESQIEYALNDVRYLPHLLQKLEDGLSSEHLLSLAHSCFSQIPLMVKLDVSGYTGIYNY